MRKLVFRDNKEFYTELKGALSSGQEVEVVTDYERFSDLPQELKDIFELHRYRTNEWVNVATGAFIAGSVANVGIDYKPLYVLGGAGVGAAAGVFMGGPVGAAAGAGVGALVGMGAAAMASGKHEVDVQVDAKGKLRVVIRPKKAA